MSRSAAANNLGTVDSPVQPTSYSYDSLNDLVKVSQGSQPKRKFTYDSLKRLTKAINPESGTVLYDYDASSNLTQKTDARGVITNYFYDGLNRLTTRTYSGPAPGGTTPAVTYVYDQATVANSKGRMTSVSSSVSSYAYGEYDAMGRLKMGTQTTAGQSFTMSYTYDLAGNMISETYPSGRVVATVYDSAGRIASITGTKDAQTTAYASSFGYTSHGAVKQVKLGNNLWENTVFDQNRLQPTHVGLGTTSTTSGVVALDYTFGGTNNNGDVLTQTITAPGLSQSLVQSYSYDSLNRLEEARENQGSAGGAQQWKQRFTYDRYGNRNFDVGNTTTNVLGPNPAIDQASNRFADNQGYLYDSAGNLIQMPTGGAPNTMTYDGENRQITFTNGPSGAVTSYEYDGDGHRVKRSDLSTGTTVFVYNAMGQLATEYVTGTPSGGGTSYLTTDHLVSTRVVTKQDGTVKARYDYLPFGEELGATIGQRTTGMGYSGSDATRQKFTQKERDSESGLDYFLARYHSSAQGRFTSVDPENASVDCTDPQSWNGYAYARCNPLRYTDQDGLEYRVCSSYGCGTLTDEQFYKQRTYYETLNFVFTGNRKFFERGAIISPEGRIVAIYYQISIDDQGKRFAFEMSRNSSGSQQLIVGFVVVTGAAGTAAGALVYLAPAALPLLTRFIAPVAEKISVTGPSVAVTLMSKAQDPKLRNIIDSLYRVTAQIGSGSAADAFRQEGTHAQKLEDSIRGLLSVLDKPGLSDSDRAIAEHVLNDLKNALSGK